MSHSLFTKAPVLRAATRRAIPRPSQNFYHSSSSPKMPSGTAPLRTLFRQTTLRATAIAAQRASYPVSRQFSQQTYATSRARSPSPPPPYQARNVSVLASQNQWTRFTSPNNTLSSVRTFASTPRIQWAIETTKAVSSLSPETQDAADAAIEEIQELYATAKDEFDIASEESEKNTTYAPDDRIAARETFDQLLDFYQGIVHGPDSAVANEVKRRVGSSIRELEGAVLAMEEAALHGD